MSKKRTIEEAYQIYQLEGHGYGVENYIHDVDTDDPELNELWKNASKSLNKLTKYFDDKIDSGEINEC